MKFGPVVKPGYNAAFARLRLRVQSWPALQYRLLKVPAGPFQFFEQVKKLSKIHLSEIFAVQNPTNYDCS